MLKRDHCRIGSLEMLKNPDQESLMDHCRIGSLETGPFIPVKVPCRSLPHRQLRNISSEAAEEKYWITAA